MNNPLVQYSETREISRYRSAKPPEETLSLATSSLQQECPSHIAVSKIGRSIEAVGKEPERVDYLTAIPVVNVMLIALHVFRIRPGIVVKIDPAGEESTISFSTGLTREFESTLFFLWFVLAIVLPASVAEMLTLQVPEFGVLLPWVVVSFFFCLALSRPLTQAHIAEYIFASDLKRIRTIVLKSTEAMEASV